MTAVLFAQKRFVTTAWHSKMRLPAWKKRACRCWWLFKARQSVGGAMDLITACDCRYATKDAFFSVHETAIGMTADVGTYPRLVKLIPEGWARQMSYTAERVSADKARDIGLVNEVYDTAEEMLEAVMTIAKQIAGHCAARRVGC